MLKKISTAILAAAIAIAANANAFAASNNGTNDERRTNATSKTAESKKWLETAPTTGEKAFDPGSQKSTMADYQKQKAAGKKLSTTTKVLIGVGIAIAVAAIVFVVAKDDLEDNILR